MNRVMTKDAAHAWRCQLSYGPMAYWKILTVRDDIGSFIFIVKKELLKDVNRRGAVSPVTRAIDSRMPVSMPVAAPR